MYQNTRIHRVIFTHSHTNTATKTRSNIHVDLAALVCSCACVCDCAPDLLCRLALKIACTENCSTHIHTQAMRESNVHTLKYNNNKNNLHCTHAHTSAINSGSGIPSCIHTHARAHTQQVSPCVQLLLLLLLPYIAYLCSVSTLCTSAYIKNV